MVLDLDFFLFYLTLVPLKFMFGKIIQHWALSLNLPHRPFCLLLWEFLLLKTLFCTAGYLLGNHCSMFWDDHEGLRNFMWKTSRNYRRCLPLNEYESKAFLCFSTLVVRSGLRLLRKSLFLLYGTWHTWNGPS